MANETEVDARLWMKHRTSLGRILLADNTLRNCTLSPGKWRIYGSSTQVYYAVRWATDAIGTLVSGESAPTLGSLNAPVVTATAGFAWGDNGNVMAESGASKLAGNVLPTDSNLYKEFVVPTGQYLKIYLATASATTNVMLEGPQ
jgi:hypothetical protein